MHYGTNMGVALNHIVNISPCILNLHLFTMVICLSYVTNNLKNI